MRHRHRPAGRGSGLLTLIAGAVAVGAVADLVSFIDRDGRRIGPDVVDLAGEHSFPASDPPPWPGGREPAAEA